MGMGRVDELMFCSRTKRRCLRAEERSRASAERLAAERLASNALAWLEEAVREDNTPSWGYLRTLEGSWPEKLAALALTRSDSVTRALLTFRLMACGKGGVVKGGEEWVEKKKVKDICGGVYDLV